MSIHRIIDSDPVETQEWLDSLAAVVELAGPERAKFLLTTLRDWANASGVPVPFNVNSPYINTIPADRQPV
jgi:pyruvate dehydrogenase E1 component